MNSVSITKNNPRHDRTVIREFLLHLAGELKKQQLALSGHLLPPKLNLGVLQFRSRYGVNLLPDADALGLLPDSPDGDPERDAARQSLINRRVEQGKYVMGLLDLLGELTLTAPEVRG